MFCMSILPRRICSRQYCFRELNTFSSRPRWIANDNAGGIDEQHLFDEFPNWDLSRLNALLASYMRDGNATSTWSLFQRMHLTCSSLSSYTFTPVLGACSVLPDPRRGQQVHALMIKTGSDSETITKTALVDMYSKYAYLIDSVRAFEEIVTKDVVAWNALLSTFLRNGLPKNVLQAFEEMKREEVVFSVHTMCTLLTACASLKALRQGKQVHGLVVTVGRDLVVLGTALIDLYSNAGHIEEAMKLYVVIDCRKDDAMHNSMVFGCLRNSRYKEAYSLLSKMEPNVVMLTSVLAACSESSDLWVGKQVHAIAMRLGFLFDTQLCNSLLDMYAKCGKISTAHLLFDRIHKKDVVSWTSMIDAYGCHGYGHEAIDLFNMMGQEANNVLPNAVTLLAVLSACGHSGLVEQGRECFTSVKEKHGLVPGPEHYACLIDILGRASLIDDVWCLFDDMNKDGIKPTAAIWAALLNACRHNLDASRGEYAARHLMELEPNKPENYVLLSNFYAAMGRHDAADELRSKMRGMCLDKEMGSSWVSTAQS